MIKGAIKILFIEDSPTDLELVKHAIKKSEIQFIEKVVETKEDFIDALTSYAPDIILSDYSLPTFNGMKALILRQELAPLVPFILVTGSNNEEVAVECIKAGADDYILKDKLARLGQAIKAVIVKYEVIISKKEAEEALRESERKFRDIVTYLDEGYYNCLIDGTLLEHNLAFNRILGFEPISDLKGTLLPDFWKEPNDRTEYLNKLMNRGFVNNYQVNAKTIHGTKIVVMASAHAVKDKNGKPERIEGTIIDITDRKKAEEELIKAKDKAEESDRLKTSFLHNISHEIRTPMNAIIGFSDLLNEPGLTTEKLKKFTDIIVQSTYQLLSIITDIVSISSIEAGHEGIVESEMNLNLKCKLLYNQFIPLALKKNLTLSYEPTLDEKEALIITDVTKVIQVLTNLLNNAFKFTGKGSIEFGYQLKKNNLEFYVKDTGIGIPHEKHNIIFERFRQVDENIARNYGGTGLGLSIAKTYVELLGGKIWLESETEDLTTGKAGGSTFFFTIPYNPINKKAVKSIIGEAQEKFSFKEEKTILIAEDEYVNYYLFEELLYGLNIKLLYARDGREAVDLFKSNPGINLVLMDIKMPVMDGLEATSIIKSINPDIPVIAQTAYGNYEERENVLINRFSAYIYKPVSKEKLLGVLRDYL